MASINHEVPELNPLNLNAGEPPAEGMEASEHHPDGIHANHEPNVEENNEDFSYADAEEATESDWDSSDSEDEEEEIQMIGRPFFWRVALVPEAESDNEDPTEVVHVGVSCDECGVKPVRGTVYHSTRIIDYDICEECYENNHKHLTLADAFLVRSRRHRYAVDDEHFEDPRSMRVNTYGWPDLFRKLQSNQRIQNLDIKTTARYIQVGPEVNQGIKNCIANSTTLKVLYATFPTGGQTHHSEVVTALVEGISENQSILTLSISMDFTWVSAVRDLCRLIRGNTSIRFMFLRHRQAARFDIERVEELLAREEDREQQIRIQVHNSALLFFRALAHESSVHSFTCEGVEDIGEESRVAALAALRSRPSLKRIKADFLVKNDDLEQLMQDKKENWMKGWNDPDSSNEDRLQILEEILSCKQVEEQDQVAAIFHFVRSNPGSLPELQDSSTQNESKKARLE